MNDKIKSNIPDNIPDTDMVQNDEYVTEEIDGDPNEDQGWDQK